MNIDNLILSLFIVVCLSPIHYCYLFFFLPYYIYYYRYNKIVKFLICFVLAEFIFKAYSVIINMFYGSIQSVNQKNIDDSSTENYIVAIISALIVAPILEELIFRKFLHHIITNKKHFIAISSCLFGLVHCLEETDNTKAVIFKISYSLGGLYLSILYTEYNSIYVPIIAHFMHNLISVLNI